jgi:hypothetical protein
VQTLASVGKPFAEKAVNEQIGQNVAHRRQHGYGLWVFHAKKDLRGYPESLRFVSQLSG